MTHRSVQSVERGVPSPKNATAAAARIFDEALEHLRLCSEDTGTVSDHWSHTLDQRSSAFSLEDMSTMLAPGNPVNARIRYMAYLIDAGAIDAGDPVQARLLALGESDVGRPRREIPLGQDIFSSPFLNTVGLAGKVIVAIEQAGIENPTIMEIGGGLGLLAGAIRDYYGDRATLICVDIPEILMIQEWYLRTRFPAAETTFQSTSQTKGLKTGGINFVNAYELLAGEVPIDVAVNVNSMQDMKASVANAYIGYVEKNISPGGVFYFQNTTGQSTSSAPEPSEYEFDPYWTLASVDVASQIETCMPSEELRAVFVRTETPEDAAVRRQALRLVWNGTMSGAWPPATGDADSLCRLAQQPKAEQRRTLQAFGLGQTDTAALSSGPHFPQESFRKPFAGLADMPMARMRNAQGRLVELLHRAPEDALGIAQEIKTLCRDTDRGLASDAVQGSEYWAAYIASFLLPLGAREVARERLARVTETSRSAAWLIRFSHLFAAYGFSDDAMKALAKAKQASGHDLLIALKGTEIEHACGETKHAQETLRQITERTDVPPSLTPTLAKTAARIGSAVELRTICLALADAGASAESTLVDILAFAADALSVDAASDIHASIEAQLPFGAASPSAAAAYGRLLVRLDRAEDGYQLLDQATKEFADSYFRLGWLGRLFQEIGDDGRADACFDRSLEIRPGNFMHYEFIGSVYFAAGRWRIAGERFDHVVSLKPYLRYIQGRAAYCKLPGAVRDSGIFGQSHELDMVFQFNQLYYHDIGLH